MVKAKSSALPLPSSRPCCLHQLPGKFLLRSIFVGNNVIKARQVFCLAFTTWSPMLPLLIAWLVSIKEYYWSMIEVGHITLEKRW